MKATHSGPLAPRSALVPVPIDQGWVSGLVLLIFGAVFPWVVGVLVLAALLVRLALRVFGGVE